MLVTPAWVAMFQTCAEVEITGVVVEDLVDKKKL